GADLPTTPAPRPGPPGRRLRLAQLPAARRLVPGPPRHLVARRRRHLPEQRGSTVWLPPPPDPRELRVGHPDGRRRPTRLHPTRPHRPAAAPATQPPAHGATAVTAALGRKPPAGRCR